MNNTQPAMEVVSGSNERMEIGDDSGASTTASQDVNGAPAITRLPCELWGIILSPLDKASVGNFRRVSSHFRRVSQRPFKDIFIAHQPCIFTKLGLGRLQTMLQHLEYRTAIKHIEFLQVVPDFIPQDQDYLQYFEDVLEIERLYKIYRAKHIKEIKNLLGSCIATMKTNNLDISFSIKSLRFDSVIRATGSGKDMLEILELSEYPWPEEDAQEWTEARARPGDIPQGPLDSTAEILLRALSKAQYPIKKLQIGRKREGFLREIFHPERTTLPSPLTTLTTLILRLEGFQGTIGDHDPVAWMRMAPALTSLTLETHLSHGPLDDHDSKYLLFLRDALCQNQLTHLKLCGFGARCEDIVSLLVTHQENLKSLTVRRCSLFGRDCWSHVLGNVKEFQQLEYLEFGWLERVTGEDRVRMSFVRDVANEQRRDDEMIWHGSEIINHQLVELLANDIRYEQ